MYIKLKKRWKKDKDVNHNVWCPECIAICVEEHACGLPLDYA
jgi:hypothetical protein